MLTVRPASQLWPDQMKWSVSRTLIKKLKSKLFAHSRRISMNTYCREPACEDLDLAPKKDPEEMSIEPGEFVHKGESSKPCHLLE